MDGAMAYFGKSEEDRLVVIACAGTLTSNASATQATQFLCDHRMSPANSS